MKQKYYNKVNNNLVIANLYANNAKYIGKFLEKTYYYKDKIIVDNGVKILIKNNLYKNKQREDRIKRIFELFGGRITLSEPFMRDTSRQEPFMRSLASHEQNGIEYMKITANNTNSIKTLENILLGGDGKKDYPYMKHYSKLNKETIFSYVQKHRLDYKIINNHVYFVENYSAFRLLNSITDFFNEECRIECRKRNDVSPISYYLNNKEEIDKILNLYEKRKVIMNKRECTLFRITVAMQIIKYFKAKRWLDMSSGWGDRLIAAILSNLDLYCGTDPNQCLHKGYDEIKTFFKANKNKYITVQSPFEEADLGNNKFDLFFSSPPFFDKEVYIPDNDTYRDKQSYINYSNIDDWVDKFMIFSVKKSLKYLDKGAHIVLYIEDPYEKDNSYVDKFIEKMKNIIEIQYVDTFFYIYQDRLSDLNSARPLYVWKVL